MTFLDDRPVDTDDAERIKVIDENIQVLEQQLMVLRAERAQLRWQGSGQQVQWTGEMLGQWDVIRTLGGYAGQLGTQAPYRTYTYDTAELRAQQRVLHEAMQQQLATMTPYVAYDIETPPLQREAEPRTEPQPPDEEPRPRPRWRR